MICSRKEIMNFDIIWEDYMQEDARLANREALLKEYDQALDTHTKRRRIQPKFNKRNRREYQPP